MKKKAKTKAEKKLVLAKETLKKLEESDRLKEVNGGLCVSGAAISCQTVDVC